jgi:nucleoredoxin
MKRPNLSTAGSVACGLAFLAMAGVALFPGQLTGEDAAKAPEGLAFLPEKLIDSEGKEVLRENALQGKVVGLYFSAKWCPPCRAFTPELVKFRDANSKDFELILVSFDKDEKEQKDYMTTYGMKFPAVAFEGEDRQKLAERYGVAGIPTLVILGSDGKEITRNGRADVTADPQGALAKWKKG